MSDRRYDEGMAARERETLEQLDALGIGFGRSETSTSGAAYTVELRPPETDDELEPYATVAPTWEVDWWKVLGCLLVVVVSLGFWALVAWTVSRLLRG